MLPVFDILDAKTATNFQFILDAGKLKNVLRQTHLPDLDRRENSAEHTWHLILMALVLKDASNEDINLEKVLSMLALHDLGEINIGDTFFYDEARGNAAANERNNIIKILSSLDPDMASHFLALWDEFENGITPEAKFAKALDRLHPFLGNLENGGESWRRNKISLAAALKKNAPIAEGSASLWDCYTRLAEEGDRTGLFHKEKAL